MTKHNYLITVMVNIKNENELLRENMTQYLREGKSFSHPKGENVFPKGVLMELDTKR